MALPADLRWYGSVGAGPRDVAILLLTRNIVPLRGERAFGIEVVLSSAVSHVLVALAAITRPHIIAVNA